MPHSRGVHGLGLLLLKAADAVDGRKRNLGVLHPDAHAVILVALMGMGVGRVVENVAAIHP